MELSSPTTFSVPAQRTDLYHRVLEQIQAVPGVESAGIIGDLFIGNPREQVLTVEGDDGTVSERLRFPRDEVSADFFKTLGTPLLRGRFFSIGDGPDAPPVAIINDAMARRSWPGRDPVGRRFKLGPRDSDRPWYTVVGVVADMRRQGLEREPVPQMFESLAQNPPAERGPFHPNLVGRPAGDGRGTSSGRASRGEACADLWGGASGSSSSEPTSRSVASRPRS